MRRRTNRRISYSIGLLATFSLNFALSASANGNDISEIELGRRFGDTVQPFLEAYCISCHDQEKKKADVDLSPYTTVASVVRDHELWALALDMLEFGDMPPEEAKTHPTPEARDSVVAWISEARKYAAAKSKGDPGIVLARRLSNREYDYTIRDLAGVDIRPTKTLPVDPANMAGFDNSGETLVMSPTLLGKFIKSAREVANHMYLQFDDFSFAPHPMIANSDREKFFVHSIIDFYDRQNIDYADYFETAWRFKHRVQLGHPNAKRAGLAARSGVSAKYLDTIWSALEESPEEIGPLAKLQEMWRALPYPEAEQYDLARRGCESMRAYTVQLRKKIEPRFLNLQSEQVQSSAVPLLIWKNSQYATHRRVFDPDQLQVDGKITLKEPVEEPGTENQFGPGKTQTIENAPGDPDLFVPAGQRPRYEAAFAKFCRIFPDMFYKEERGRNYFNTTKDRGRYLNAGFHSRMGYFRDDWPLYELLLDEAQQKQLDELWGQLDFIGNTTIRTYQEFIGTDAVRQQAEEAASLLDADEDEYSYSEREIRLAEERYLEKTTDADTMVREAIREYFSAIADTIGWLDEARLQAKPRHLEALLDFAARAYRRPLAEEEKQDLLSFYREALADGLDHESSLRESIVAILTYPDMAYRIDLVDAGPGVQPLSDYALASRLSYFIWSSMPDEALLARAAAGDLHQPEVIAAEARRMLKDPKARALAVEFGGNWLGFRRFQEIGTVDLEHSPNFTVELKEAMYEEPIHFLADVFQNNRSILDFLYASHTFANPVLAEHYGIPLPEEGGDAWRRINDANRYGRGGLLPMATFLTAYAPGLRTSPVKRGNWVVKNILGERVPPPPADVPDLPSNEAELDLPLRDILAQHRDNPACSSCHARFDSFGLVFEGYGLLGERRQRDLGGHPIDAMAEFPDGSQGDGLEGVLQHISAKRQDDFVENFCGKLLAFAVGRSLILSDGVMIEEMRGALAENGYCFNIAVESIVTSPQFLNKRGRESGYAHNP